MLYEFDLRLRLQLEDQAMGRVFGFLKKLKARKGTERSGERVHFGISPDEFVEGNTGDILPIEELGIGDESKE